MRSLTLADVVFPHITFIDDFPEYNLLLSLIDSPWMQRLRDVNQTANTRLVYMYSEHSRFGHSLGVSFLADQTLRKLRISPYISSAQKEEIINIHGAVVIAALLHDIGHVAPGSHIAARAWFPKQEDKHEKVGERIISQLLDGDLQCKVSDILYSGNSFPWATELISGGGWNVDRGNWCIADSVLAGVNYGKYNINAINESLTLTPDNHLALRENRLDAMVHFGVSRYALYRQLYQHRVLLAADALTISLIKRLRYLREVKASFFRDEELDIVLGAIDILDLPLPTIFRMRESWFRYHLSRWLEVDDPILRDLSDRLLHRRLLKTVKTNDLSELEKIKEVAKSCGYDPDYYIFLLHNHGTIGDDLQSIMKVRGEDGIIRSIDELDPLFAVLGEMPKQNWIALPKEVKDKITN
jgi:hypothetical protein